MTREERVLRTIRRDSIDYLPSNIYFASHEKKLSLMETFQFSSLNEFDDFLENHLYLTSPMDDTFRFRGDHEMRKKPFLLKLIGITVFSMIDGE